ncbi:DUF4139 domain-containing protein [uncultured Campylobacter sp.]|uniref:DUF4139 domain-containing protein n=1 Tax=uncultured Campylobacter sp. TaxID=218934 RepID=UPI0025E4E58D|nr:DUF4139 domain-containing protein [uncultured Campylobacter sp.]
MKKIVLLSAAAALAVNLSAQENSLEIYANSAFLYQSFGAQKSNFSVNVPEYLDIRSIEIAGSCEVRELSLGEIEPVKNAEFAKKEADEKSLRELNDRLVALKAQQRFLSDFASLKDRSLASLKADSQKVYDEVLLVAGEISKTDEQIGKLKEKISKYVIKNERRLNANFGCDPSFVKISYPVDVSAYTHNELSADLASGKIEVAQKLSVQNPLNAELANLTIALYPYEYSSQTAPQPFYPWYEGEPERPAPAAAYKKDVMLEEATMDRVAPAMEARSSYARTGSNIESSLSKVWKISGVSLKAGEAGEFSFDKQSLYAKFDLLIDGYGSEAAYVRAKFSPERSIEESETLIKLDGVQIGLVHLGFAANSEATAYLGKNSLIEVKKEQANSFTKNSFFGGESKNSMAWDYEIKNSSKRAWNVVLQERAPVSTHEDVKVALKNSPEQSSLGKDGLLSWDFELKPGESKKIHFGYELSKPKK